MPKNTPTLDVKCPQCGDENEKMLRTDLRAAASITVLVCGCEWEFSKNQSVKIPGNLVRHAAEAMNVHEGFSSLGEYVRDCVRRMNEHHLKQGQQENFTQLMGAIGENPELFARMIEDVEDDK